MRSIIIVLLCATLVATAACAADNGWLARIRATGIFPNEKSDPNPMAELSANDLKLDNKVTPELGFAYRFGRGFAAELAIPLPAEFGVTVQSTNTPVCLFDAWMPSLTIQYRIAPEHNVVPYVGLGLNYTKFDDVRFLMNEPGLAMDGSRWGTVFQTGIDWKVGDRSFVNVDVRKIWLNTDITQNLAKITTVKIDPWLAAIGFGWKL